MDNNIFMGNDSTFKIITREGSGIDTYANTYNYGLSYLYYVTFNDGSDTSTVNIEGGNKITKPTDPTKEGNNFMGWYIDSSLTTAFDFNTPITSDMTLYAKWELKTYQITVQANKGGNISPTSPITVNYDANQVLTITVDLGYKNKSVSVDGVNKTNSLVNNKLTLTNVKADALIKVEFEPISYKFIEGENQTYKDEDMIFKLNGIYSLLDKVYVNGKELDSKYYTTKEGSTIITLKKEYLDTLKNGTYKLKITYKNGTSNETTFKIEKKEVLSSNEEKEDTPTITPKKEEPTKGSVSKNNPQTSDNSIIYIILTSMSLIGLTILKKYNKLMN